MNSITIHNLSKSYGDTQAVQHLSLEVEKGELFGLIGPDGAGKTTVFRMLTTLLLPDEGTATIEGWDIVKDYKEIRKHVGYMPGRFSLPRPHCRGEPHLLRHRFWYDYRRKLRPYQGYLRADKAVQQPSRRQALRGNETKVSPLLCPHSQAQSPFVRRAHHGGRCGFAQRILADAEETKGARHQHTGFHSLYGRSQPMRPHSPNASRKDTFHQHPRANHRRLPHNTLCCQGCRPVRTATAPAPEA